MSIFRTIKYLFLLLGCISFSVLQLAIAASGFQNNLLNADLAQSYSGGVNITLYTSKPYTDLVVVNKKNDYEYVILLPETSNSLFAKPDFKAASDIVKDIEVKTQQYDGNIKGYTKITILTKRAVAITPQIKTAKPAYKLSEKDYQELISQASGEKSKEEETPKIVVPVEKTVVEKAKPKTQPKIITTDKLAKIKPEKSVATVPKEKTIKKIIQEKKSVVPAEKIKPKEKAEKAVQPKTIEEPEVQEQVLPQETVETAEAQPQEKLSPDLAEQKQELTQKYKKLIKNNLILIFVFILIAFIFLLRIARKITKNFQKNKQIFTEQLKEEPAKTPDYSEKITEDMSWQEKYKAFSDYDRTVSEETEPEVSHEEFAEQGINPEINELFKEPEEGIEEEVISGEQILPEEPEIKVEPEPEYEEPVFDDILSYQGNEEVFDETLTPEQLFEEEEEEPFVEELQLEEQPIEGFQEEEYQPFITEPEIQEEKEIIKSEFNIDNSKGFYLVDFEDTTSLVGQIDDEIFVLKRFNEKIDNKLQARVNEKTPNSISYMTKVGDFKGIVEVTPDNMKLLIEL